MRSVTSPHNRLIRLTEERWAHIMEEHGELRGMQAMVLGTVASPERILLGGAEEYLAMREVEPGKWLVVVYREGAEDGFIITAFLTRKRRQLDRRIQRWP